MVKTIAVIQARLSSTRLPAKVMLDLDGQTLLQRVINRVRLSKFVDEIYVATSINNEDNVIANLCNTIQIECYRGSLENVLSRFYEIGKIKNADIIVRITADNPLTEPKMIDKAIEFITHTKKDYVGFKDVPYGSAVEVFTMKSFEKIYKATNLSKHNLEHVTSYYYQNREMFDIALLSYDIGNSKNRVTVDTLEDYIKMTYYYSYFEKKQIDQKSYLETVIQLQAREN